MYPRFHKFLSILFVLTVWVWIGQPARADKGNMRVLRVALLQNRPLSYPEDDGRAKGVYPEVIRKIAERENWSLDFVLDSWSDSLKRLENGQIDVMIAIVRSPEREKLFDFSREPVLTAWGQVYTKPGSEIDSILDLRDKKVAIMEGDINGRNFMELAQKFNVNCTFVSVKHFEDVCRAILAGEVDAGVMLNVSGGYLMRQFPVRPSPIVFSPGSGHFAVQKGKHTDILDTIDRYLSEWKADRSSVYYQILNRNYGVGERGGLPIRMILMIGGIVLGLSLLFFLWVTVLRRQVSQRTKDLEEARLRQNEAVNAGNVGLWHWNFETNKVNYSREWKRQIGYEDHEISDDFEEWKSRVHPDDLEQTLEKVNRSIAEGRKDHKVEFRFRHRDGSYRWILAQASILQDEKGHPIRMLGSHIDITDRKRGEVEQESLQAQLSNALEMAHLGHWEYDVVNDLFAFNDYFYKVFRTTAKQIGGYTMSSAEYARRFIHPDDRHVVVEETRKAIEATGSNFSRQLEHRMLFADGTIGHIAVRFFIVKDAQGKTIKTYGVNQDITERKRLEQELLRVQKLESLGVFAGGIAHDFNNILTTILGNVSMAKMEVSREGDMFDLLNEAEMASRRAQMLTKQLLTFAKGGVPVKEIASIMAILKESSSFVMHGSKSDCEFSIAEDLWPAEVDVGQISQAINNIVINANQAMPKGGTIQVAAENLIIENRLGLPVNPGRYIRISITDQGVGIAEDYILNVFDPYFTTKHEGSGLGLATTYSIIKKHDGHITVESQPGVGSTFHIYLPASEKVVPEKEESRLIKGHGRILVMDDEAPLRKMAGRMLGNLGYESEFAKDGAETIRMFKEAKEAKKPYDAVILDLTIPGGMGGKEAINKLLEIDPEVKAIVSSGYSNDPVLANFQEYGFKGMMPKPFESRSLGKVLHEVLKGEKE